MEKNVILTKEGKEINIDKNKNLFKKIKNKRPKGRLFYLPSPYIRAYCLNFFKKPSVKIAVSPQIIGLSSPKS